MTTDWSWLWLATVPAVALYTRLSRPAILENATRRRVFEFVCGNPGARCAEAARDAAVAYKTAERHLRLLVRFGFLAAVPAPAGSRYFECGGPSGNEREVIAALRGGGIRDALELVRRTPGIGVTEAARRLGVSKSTASERLSKLRAAGIVRPVRRGAARVFGVVEHEDMRDRPDGGSSPKGR